MGNNNKNLKILFGLSLMVFLIISQTSQVAAANNQGFEWGIAIDDRFDYEVKATYHNSTLDIDVDDTMYVVIDDLPTIADGITSLAQLTFLDFSLYWENGTDMNSFWKEIISVIPFYLYPVGNWTLLETLYMDSDPQAEVTQDASVFTISRTPTETYNVTLTVLKSDGALAYIDMEWDRSRMEDEDELSFELIRDGYVLPTSTTTTPTDTTTGSTGSTTPTTPLGDGTFLLILGGGAAAAVLIFVVVIFAKKRG